MPKGVLLVGVDGSGPSRAALRWALGQARSTGASIEAVTTWQATAPVYGIGQVPVDIQPVDPTEAATRTLEETVTAVRGEERHGPDAGADVSLRHRVVQGHPAPTLLELAREADRLGVGTHGHGAFAGMLLGSVSAHVTGRCPCPVVVVPDRDADTRHGDR